MIVQWVGYVRYSRGIDQCGIHEVLALWWCFASGSAASSLPSHTATASSLSIRHVFLMISQKVCEVTMEPCHLYSLLDKSHQTLRLSLPSLDLRKARSQKKINKPISRQTFLWLLDSPIAIGMTFFTINNEVC